MGDFGDAFDYIFHARESQAGGAQGGRQRAVAARSGRTSR